MAVLVLMDVMGFFSTDSLTVHSLAYLVLLNIKIMLTVIVHVLSGVQTDLYSTAYC